MTKYGCKSLKQEAKSQRSKVWKRALYPFQPYTVHAFSSFDSEKLKIGILTSTFWKGYRQNWSESFFGEMKRGKDVGCAQPVLPIHNVLTQIYQLYTMIRHSEIFRLEPRSILTENPVNILFTLSWNACSRNLLRACSTPDLNCTFWHTLTVILCLE